MAGRCILQAKHATLARPAVLAWPRMKRRDVSRHDSAPVHSDTPVPAGAGRVDVFMDTLRSVQRLGPASSHFQDAGL
jgi:hypothetical protein